MKAAKVRALRKSGFEGHIIRCNDGDDALDYLHRRGDFTDRVSFQRPELILLDLNLPGTDGREVLKTVKENPALRTIPVVVFTTSDHPGDITTCYELGANSYIVKPVDISKLMGTMKKLKDYWLDVVLLPQEEV